MDVSGVDASALAASARALYALAALLWIGLALRTRRPVVLLAGAVLANAWVWLVTNWPLQRMYGLGPSHDRVGNLGLVQVVAAGNSPLRTSQVGQLHFEPLWGLLVAAVSGFDPDRVLVLYPYLALVMPCALAITLYAALAPLGDATDPDAWSGWERALVAGFATLLCSSPFDFTETYRVPWAKMFLLKPNHALALVLFPFVLRLFARARGWRGRVLAGLALHVLAWAFVLYMAYVAVGLVTLVVLSFLFTRERARGDAVDVAVVLLVNAVIVSPYLVMLLFGYPFLSRSPEMVLPPESPHLLETTARLWPLFLLGAWGAVLAWRRGDRMGRAWAAQVVGAQALWAGYLVLSWLQLARERDEIHYWTRVLIAASAAIGAFDFGRRLLAWIAPPGEAARAAAAVCLVAMPFTLPYWYDPVRMDSYVPVSLTPLPQRISRLTEYVRHNTDPHAVFAGDRDLARWISALGARRALRTNALHLAKDAADRIALEERVFREGDDAALQAARARYGVEYLVVTPSILAEHQGVTLDVLQHRASLEQVYFLDDEERGWVALFRLRPAGGGRS